MPSVNPFQKVCIAYVRARRDYEGSHTHAAHRCPNNMEVAHYDLGYREASLPKIGIIPIRYMIVGGTM